MNKLYVSIVFFTIILLGLSFRLYGLNWDSGTHMHPDERAIVLSVTNLTYPSSVSQFLSTDSPWNPKFFAYGSFPFYLLRVVGDIAGFVDPSLATYDGINLVGRVLSTFFDIGTITILYFLGKHLSGRKIGLLASFFYSVSILPIQLSHFYAVDTALTFFVTATLYVLILFYERPSTKKSLLVGFLIGCALATKISATLLISSFGLTLLLEFLLIFLKSPHRITSWSGHLTPTLKKIASYGLLTCSVGLLTFLFFQPYALIDFSTFYRQIIEQSHMTNDAFTFPYTLQYVGKTPYIYELINIFFFGLGPLLAITGLSGLLYVLYRVVCKEKHFPWQKMIILLQFFITYFLITGSFAIGFMRYMLPLYPLLCIFSAYLLLNPIINTFQTKNTLGRIVISITFILLVLFPLSFLSIYSKPNTRIVATDWILQNVPKGSTIATEHWDDVVPIRGQENFTFVSLPMYEPDTKEKWELMNQLLSQTDYIVIASNRLYTPLMKLTDCQNLPSHRCYLRSSLYYKELFDGTMGFTKIAEFTSYPNIPFTTLSFSDQMADESFTVYDHPKIMIFKKQ